MFSQKDKEIAEKKRNLDLSVVLRFSAMGVVAFEGVASSQKEPYSSLAVQIFVKSGSILLNTEMLVTRPPAELFTIAPGISLSKEQILDKNTSNPHGLHFTKSLLERHFRYNTSIDLSGLGPIPASAVAQNFTIIGQEGGLGELSASAVELTTGMVRMNATACPAKKDHPSGWV